MNIEFYKNKILSRVTMVNGCWLWQGSINTDGYGNFWMEGKCWKAHRASYVLFIGEIAEKMCVCHSCDTPSCLNPQHLWLGSHVENMQDMMKKKRTLYGEQRPNNKIPISLRQILADRYIAGETQLQLAKEFNCHPSAIYSAIHHIVPISKPGFVGIDHPRTKFTEEDIRNIREDYSTGQSLSKLAHDYEVSISTIRAITSKRNWKHIV